jgi:hypothetical protein
MAQRRHAERDETQPSGPQRTGSLLALAAGIAALALSPVVAYVAASLGEGPQPGSPAVWTVPGVALVVLYALVGPAGAFTAWGTADGGGRLPVIGAAVAVAAHLAALAVLWLASADGWTWGVALLTFLALFALPALLATAAGVVLRRAETRQHEDT